MPARPALRTSIAPAVAVAAVAATATVAWRLGRAAWGVPSALGASRKAIADSATRSSAFADGAFTNRLPSTMLAANSIPQLTKAMIQRRGTGKPHGRIPLATTAAGERAGELGVTWLGHASVLIEVDGSYILADPVVGERVSPSATVGPSRLHPAPTPLETLPEVAAIVISHDHYDHLEQRTVQRLVDLQPAPFVVPLGVGAHLRRWRVPEDRIIELDWDESARVGDLTLTCTEARHFSGRGFARNSTLWSSWALIGPRHRVFFGGDTGYTRAFEGIGARYGSFALTLLPIGAYSEYWPDIHMNPEEAWRAHGDLGGGYLVPIHWGTFDLALHSWAEPVQRLLAAAGDDPRILIPRPGERLDVSDGRPDLQPWWKALA